VQTCEDCQRHRTRYGGDSKEEQYDYDCWCGEAGSSGRHQRHCPEQSDNPQDARQCPGFQE